MAHAGPAYDGILASILPPDEMIAAYRHAAAWGVSPHDVLLTGPEQRIAEYLQRLAGRLGVDYAAFQSLPEGSISATQAVAALRSGVFRHPETGNFTIVPRGPNMQALPLILRRDPSLRQRVRLMHPAAFAHMMASGAGADVAALMARGPAAIDPVLCASPLGMTRLAGPVLMVVMTGGALAAITGLEAAHLPFALAFMMLTAIRIWALLAFRPRLPPRDLPHARDLPVYTVLVPLRQEAQALEGLITALAALDYPPAKLDIKLLIEADDAETQLALFGLPLPGHMERILLPPGEPRTKPRALNFGLATARGSLLVIYDAEDRPEPEQLKIAADAFAHADGMLACAQARLSIDNTGDNWITRAFTIEYAGLFEIFLPTLARRGRMIPLGGTSNHFRTAALRAVGGWDAYNVTEDADLGVRLARRGWRSGTLPSVTYEEAPNTAIAWLKQRTRWLKGYIITWCVHMRRPRALLRELGWWDFLVFQSVIGGVPLAALAQAVCVSVIGWHLWAGTLISGGAVAMTLAGLQLFNLAAGYAAAAAICRVGIGQQGLRRHGPALWLLIPYWLLVTVAAYRALWQLTFQPFRWEKTRHGLARTTRGHK